MLLGPDAAEAVRIQTNVPVLIEKPLKVAALLRVFHHFSAINTVCDGSKSFSLVKAGNGGAVEAGPFEFVAALFKHSYCKCEAFGICTRADGAQRVNSGCAL